MNIRNFCMIFMIKYLYTYSVNTSKCIYVCISKRIGFMFMGFREEVGIKASVSLQFPFAALRNRS